MPDGPDRAEPRRDRTAGDAGDAIETGRRRMAHTETRFVRWDDQEWEPVTDLLRRRLITGERAMLAQVFLDRGAIVPRHAHENEQFTYILEGALRFWLGEEGQREVIVRAGEVLHIPSHVPHKAEALEDTLDLDVFCPPRQDWLDGTDTYFHDPVEG